MNEPAAKEWLNKAWHHFSSGKILYEANHYTDVIAVDFHYAAEIILKSFLAYENKKILKIHDLNELSILTSDYISFDNEEQKLMAIITKYHIKASYPTYDRILPPREELNHYGLKVHRLLRD
ncbi:MAG: HEPN domain-containing protein [Campylobacterota bacterium]|nr:HEPN domain-containing protein [Campylobacterota bacterium]